MYKKRITNLFIITMLLCANSVGASPALQVINNNWKFKQARLNNWHPAEVPGVVHTDLMNNKLLEDPYFRLNEKSIQWVDKEDWIYETSFDLLPEQKGKDHIDLLFYGLDTYATVSLNGQEILETNNMFRTWRIDVKELIKEKENTLRVYFHSPIKKAMPEWEALPFQYRTANDQSQNGGVFDRELSVFTRKAGYHYGWDWGPRIVTSGIWRPVVLEAWNEARINNTHFIQKNVTAKKASVLLKTEIVSGKDLQQVRIQVNDSGSKRMLTFTIQDIKKGLNVVELPFDIENPSLWWSNGLGKAHLYTFETRLSREGDVLDTQSDKIGLRSIKLVREPDQYGKSFYFELNGVPVFSKGANYIPCDMFLPRVSKDIYERTILDAVNANMNMLRVWGGGIYEDDYFYDLCDEYGILVWQDFMFACSLYPAEGEMLENIREEAIDNVRRLRNHPCIALWCGNNENLEAWYGWGWKTGYDKLDPAYTQTIWKQYYDQYHVVLPEVVKEYDPMTSYTPSSPFRDINGRQGINDGDFHYWSTWQNALPTSTFNNPKSRYFSEYGYQSFPTFESVKKYAPEKEDWNPYSDVMMWHQRGGMKANERINKIIDAEYGVPKDFPSFLYLSQVLQGDAIKIAMEAHRRDMPYCMGSLYWQHNDCWPVASWSSRDYFGQWKAQHYYARQAFRDVLVSPVEKEGLLEIYAVSDRLKPFTADLKIMLFDFYGKELSTIRKKVRIPANKSTLVDNVNIDSFLKGANRKDVFIRVELADKQTVYDNHYFLLLQKDLSYPEAQIATKLKKGNSGYMLELNSKVFVKSVFVSVKDDVKHFFSDNFFDLLPNETKTVNIRTDLSFEELEKGLELTCLKEALANKQE